MQVPHIHKPKEMTQMSPESPKPVSPADGEKIRIENLKLIVPDRPIIPFIEGDGSGPDIWRASERVIDAAVEKAYGGKRQIRWMEVYAGGKSFTNFNTWLPDETIEAIREYKIAIKGPMTTPIGGGIRSLNVALRKQLDLYVCLRPVRWFAGVPNPMQHPEFVNMVIFRENTEDIYAGIEFENGTPGNQLFLKLFKENFPKEYNQIRFPDSSGIGIKPVSEEGSKRLVRAAIRYALEFKRRKVTLVHKGNIQKYTEGAFRNWGYDVAEKEFGDKVYTNRRWEATKAAQGEQVANQEQAKAVSEGKLIINDVIADAMFMNALIRPRDFDVLATTNLNGDYLSDALAAQIGGIGIAPGANINNETGAAIFEATHGTAPGKAGKDLANPSSVILSGEMMLRYMGWSEAADLIILGIERVIGARKMTIDFANQAENAILVKCSEFGDEIIKEIRNSAA
jgi:isocitrate dehydrogenase